MSDKNFKELGDKFERMLKGLGVKNIKDIPDEYKPKEECKCIWIVK